MDDGRSIQRRRKRGGGRKGGGGTLGETRLPGLVTLGRRTVSQTSELGQGRKDRCCFSFPPTHSGSTPPMTRTDTALSPPGENLAALPIPASRWSPLPNMRYAVAATQSVLRMSNGI